MQFFKLKVQNKFIINFTTFNKKTTENIEK